MLVDLNKNYVDLAMTRGDTQGVEFWVEGFESSDDFSEIIFSCKKRVSDSDYIFQVKKSEGKIVKDHYDPSTGLTTYIVTIDSELTANLPVGVYVYDCESIYNNAVGTLFKGNLNISFDVTRNN